MYLLSYRLLDKTFAVIWKEHFKKEWPGLLLAGLAMGLLSIAMSETRVIHLILILIPFGMIVLLHRKREGLKLYELMILFLFVFLTFGLIEIPIVGLLSVLNLSDEMLFIMGNGIHVIVILFLYRLPYFIILYRHIVKDLLLQFLMIITSLLVLVVSIYLSFEFSAMYFFILVLLMGLIIATIYQLVPLIYYYTKHLPRLYHDRNTRLMAHHGRIYSESECEKARQAVDEVMAEAHLEPKMNRYVTGENEVNIQAYIENKLEQRQAKLEFKTVVQYGGDHETVPLDEIFYIVGTLIDNAIESGRSHYPAMLIVSCMRDHLVIRQSNATFNLLTENQIEKMVQAGVSTKANHGRGYGLYNLNERLEQVYGGHLQIHSYYDERAKSNFVEFIINISAQAKPKQNDKPLQ